MKKRCDNCAHWGDEEDENEYGVVFSQCRRFPPVVVPAEYRNDIDRKERERLGFRNGFFDFPWVAESEVCGEHRQSNDEGQQQVDSAAGRLSAGPNG